MRRLSTAISGAARRGAHVTGRGVSIGGRWLSAQVLAMAPQAACQGSREAAPAIPGPDSRRAGRVAHRWRLQGVRCRRDRGRSVGGAAVCPRSRGGDHDGDARGRRHRDQARRRAARGLRAGGARQRRGQDDRLCGRVGAAPRCRAGTWRPGARGRIADSKAAAAPAHREGRPERLVARAAAHRRGRRRPD